MMKDHQLRAPEGARRVSAAVVVAELNFKHVGRESLHHGTYLATFRLREGRSSNSATTAKGLTFSICFFLTTHSRLATGAAFLVALVSPCRANSTDLRRENPYLHRFKSSMALSAIFSPPPGASGVEVGS